MKKTKSSKKIVLKITMSMTDTSDHLAFVEHELKSLWVQVRLERKYLHHLIKEHVLYLQSSNSSSCCQCPILGDFRQSPIPALFRDLHSEVSSGHVRCTFSTTTKSNTTSIPLPSSLARRDKTKSRHQNTITKCQELPHDQAFYSHKARKSLRNQRTFGLRHNCHLPFKRPRQRLQPTYERSSESHLCS